MSKAPQSEGRKENAAQPLGRRDGLVSESETRKTGEAERRSAGPDAPDAGRAAAVTKPPKR